MKIHSLRFKNLNSLKGEWKIDFDHEEFNDQGLFAIMGQTGSGKTTILDAICLALYYETPRLGKITASTNEIMTRHTGECFSEVEFSANAKRYRSYWYQNRAGKKPDGKLQGAKVELVDVESAKPLETQTSKIQPLIEKITGLNFDRFTRSVMLAQGGFTAFLKADVKEKAEILEEMTGTEIYTKIGQKVFALTRDEQSKLKDLEIRLGEAKLLSEEEVTSLKTSKSKLEKQHKSEQEVEQQHQVWLTWRENLLKASQAIKQYEQDLEQSQMALQEFKPQQEVLDRYIPALNLKPTYDTLQNFIKIQHDKDLKMLSLEQDREKQDLASKEKSKELQAHISEEEGFIAKRQQEEILIKQVLPLDQDILQKTTFHQSQVKKCTELTVSLSGLKSSYGQLETQSKSLSQELKSKQEWQEEHRHLSDFEPQYPLLKSQLFTWRNQSRERRKRLLRVEELNVELKKTKLESNNLQSDYKNKNDQESKLQTKIVELKNGLEQALGENDFSSFEQATYKLEVDLKDKASLKQEAHQLNQSKQQQSKDKESIAIEVKKQQDLIRDEQSLLEKLKQSKERSQLKKKLWQKDQQISSLLEYRQELEEGEACPLCGSKEHPSIENYSALEEKISEQEYQKAQESEKKQEQELTQCRSSIQFLQQGVKDKEKSLQKQEVEWDKTHQAFLQACANFDISLKFDQTDDWIAYLEQEEKSYISQQKKLSQVQQINNDLKIFKQEQLELKTQLQNLKLAKTKLESTREKIDLEISNQQEELEQIKHNELEAKLSQALKTYQFTLPKIEQVDELINQMTEAKDAFTKIKTELDHLKQELELKKSELKTKDDQIKDLQEISRKELVKQEELEQEVNEIKKKRQAIFGDKQVEQVRLDLNKKAEKLQKNAEGIKSEVNQLKTALTVLDTQVKDLRLEQKNLREKQEEEQVKFDGELEKSTFADMANFKAALIGDEQYQALKTQSQELQNKHNLVVANLSKAKIELEQEQAKKLSLLDLATLQEKLKSQRELLEQLFTKINQVNFKLEQDKELRSESNELVKKINHQQQVLGEWSVLCELIGDATGSTFSRFAQSITLEFLTDYANLHLERICPRYQLCVGHELELFIIDTYQADNKRPVSTLSGGESFLMSLALALGLSDLASDKVSIESLFLDEGFGTLDGNTLEIALDALDSLKSEGRMIGVISHVEALKERITTRIQVFSGNGISRLEDKYKMQALDND